MSRAAVEHTGPALANSLMEDGRGVERPIIRIGTLSAIRIGGELPIQSGVASEFCCVNRRLLIV